MWKSIFKRSRLRKPKAIMTCPQCKEGEFRVARTEKDYECDAFHCVVIRTRRCSKCGYVQKTPETVEKQNATDSSKSIVIEDN
jgi:C4-type Zn-finger protein